MKIKARLMNGMTAATVIAVSVLLLAAPGAHGEDRRGAAFHGHFAARAPAARGGMHFAAPPRRFAGPVPHGGAHFAPSPHRFGGPPAQMHFAVAARYEGHFSGDRK
ncbi:MAG: hypothetical protein HIU85_03655, partial [Proteobacteria bacterium]|nr:hypothetical protein [Pseudomonadota bacterium]